MKLILLQDRFEVFKYSWIIAVYVLNSGIAISGLRLPFLIQKRRHRIRRFYSVCRSDRLQSKQKTQSNRKHDDDRHLMFCYGCILGSLLS